MLKDIRIGDRIVGENHEPFLIAEMSGNHNQSLERAFQIVDAAAESGAHAMKLQTYTADTMTLNLKEGDFFIKDESSLWSGRSLYDLYQQAHTPWEWHKPIMDRCKKLGMLCFSTPFDDTSVDFLEGLNVPCYKIASFENTYFPLLKKIAGTGRPIIMSTGMATIDELQESVEYLRVCGAQEIILLKCTSTYPATPENTNIATIPDMREMFGVHVGLSDHTMGCGVAIASVALGTVAIEKHFTLRRADGGVDSTFSMEPEEFKILSSESFRAWQSIGKVHYGVSSDKEEKSKVFRRSIYVCRDIQKGEIFTIENVRCIRPGLGLPTKYYEEILGKKSSCFIKKGTPLKFEYLA